MHQSRWMQLMKGSNFPAYRKGTVVGVTMFLKDLLGTTFSAEYVINTIFCVNGLDMELVCFRRGAHTCKIQSYVELLELSWVIWATEPAPTVSLLLLVIVLNAPCPQAQWSPLWAWFVKKGSFSSRCPLISCVFTAPLGALQVSCTSFNTISFCLCSFCWQTHTTAVTVSFW